MKLIKKYNANFNLRQNINFCPLFLIPILIKFCLKAIMLSLDIILKENLVSLILRMNILL